MRELGLADEFFLICHDDITGRPVVHDIAAHTGLAAALLAELVLSGHIDIRGKHLIVVDRRPPADAVSHEVLSQVISESEPHGLRTWLEYFSAEAQEAVGRRLTRAGYVEPRRGRTLSLRAIVRYPAIDPAASWPRVRLQGVLLDPRGLDMKSMVLAALVGATGLDRMFAFDLTVAQIRNRIERITGGLPPALHELVHSTGITVAAAIMGRRR